MAEATFELVYDEWVTIKTVDGISYQVKREEAAGDETDEDVFEDLFHVRGIRSASRGRVRTIFSFTVSRTTLEDGMGLSVDVDETEE